MAHFVQLLKFLQLKNKLKYVSVRKYNFTRRIVSLNNYKLFDASQSIIQIETYIFSTDVMNLAHRGPTAVNANLLVNAKMVGPAILCLVNATAQKDGR